MKRAYSPQARTRSSPKLVRYGVASVKPTALKQLWNAAVRVRQRPFSLANSSSPSKPTGRGRARKPVENTVLLSDLVQTLPVCHTGRGLSPHGTERRISMSKSAKSHHPNQRALRRTANLDAVAAAIARADVGALCVGDGPTLMS